MNLIPIHRIEDPRLEVYRMVRDRDIAGRQDAFIAEGRIVLKTLLDHRRFPLDSVLVSQKRLPGLRDLLAHVPDAVPIYVLPHDTMCTVVGFPIHRGLLAAGKRQPLPTSATLLAALPSGPATVLVLEGLTHSDNVGSCFRNAAALGAHAILMDAACCDPLYRRSIRVSAGCALVLPFGRDPSLHTTFQALSEHAFTTVALSPAGEDNLASTSARPAARIALIVGTEGDGLSQTAMDSADLRFAIPMASHVDSLNVATAAAIALFALR